MDLLNRKEVLTKAR